MFEDPGLAGKAVVVTGGSRGIGRELVLRFAEEGCAVTFIYQKAEEAAAQDVLLGMHDEIAEHYRLTEGDYEPHAASVDYLVAATGG